MKDLKIVFMGTPDFAVTTLRALVDAEYSIVGVVTAPDRPAGRGRKIRESAVKNYAKEKGLTILQPLKLKDPEFLSELKNLRANLQIVVAFRMLPEVVWKMPAYGTFNLHASLLPQYRGAAPINWAIINGEKETGVSTFFINENIDTGAILLQQTVPITKDDSAGTLHDKLMETGASLVLKTVMEIKKGGIQAKEQPMVEVLKEAPKLHKENCRINWRRQLLPIYNHIRGLSPYPAAWTKFQNGKEVLDIKVYKANCLYEEHNLEIGSIVATKKELKVAAEGGFISLLEIQLPAKRKMPINVVLNGLQIAQNAKML
ncbi:methionyl-tRNA formyltransferase [Eudoraea chungangensis]|uniref:methionyl-tRNA formyltransferase n=1 Tax=Eudoraea chungangensis TaxID=1481905 RepID=UPI0023ED8C97|nr:methionyl-tRNA formyltransferase [Eudoraea chungangensis]